MKATEETVEMIFYHFHADTQNKKLYVPTQVIEKARDLSSMEAKFYFERLHRYLGFEVIGWWVPLKRLLSNPNQL